MKCGYLRRRGSSCGLDFTLKSKNASTTLSVEEDCPLWAATLLEYFRFRLLRMDFVIVSEITAVETIASGKEFASASVFARSTVAIAG